MRELLSCILSSLFFFSASAQFTDISAILGMEVVRPVTEYGMGVTVYDVNKDGWDDITFTQHNDSLLLFENTGSGFILHKPVKCIGESKQALYGDYDNDGDPDLFVTTYTRPIKLYRNDGNWNFTDVTAEMGITVPQLKTFGASWGDINGDGWLDLFVANYDEGAPGCWLFLNNQGTGFTEVGAQWGINVASDFSFQGTFFDHNGDGRQDLHVANDRPPADGLFINYGDFFINEATGNGLDVYCNAMSSSVADYNHDGKYDIYVTNTYEGNMLWTRNSGGFYSNLAAEKGVTMNRTCWGATWIDWDNDSWEDLYVNNFPSEGDAFPFFYNASGTFVQEPEITSIDNAFTYSSAKGDFNGDGYPDLAISGHDGVPCRVLLNDGNENHFIRFRLEGQISNRDGIGTQIEYVLDNETEERLVRYTRAGDAYLSQDSQWIIIGLGEKDTLEYLRLDWLSGITDEYFDLKADSAYVFYEGYEEVFVYDAEMNTMAEDTVLCFGETIQLLAQYPVDVQWSNGISDMGITVSEAGTYTYLYTNDWGIAHESTPVTVHFIELPDIYLDVQPLLCFGAMNASFAWEITPGWYPNSASNTDLGPGIYEIEFSFDGRCPIDTMVEIQQPEELLLHLIQFSPHDSVIHIETTGGIYPHQVFYEGEWITTDSLSLPAGVHTITVVDANGCMTTEEVIVEEVQEVVGMEEYAEEHVVLWGEIIVRLPFLPKEMRLMNALGQIVARVRYPWNEGGESPPPGTYFAVFINEEKSFVKKVWIAE